MYMHRAIIKNKDLNMLSVKQMIVKYTYDMVNDSVKPINITKISDITEIRNKDYIACPKYFGERSWMIFIKLNGCYYAVTFFKQHRRNLINSIRLMPVEISVDEEMYNGTIIEGIYSITGGIITFIIDEIYYLAGKLQLLKPKDDRLKDFADYAYTKFGGSPNYNVHFCHHYQIEKKVWNYFMTELNQIIQFRRLYFILKNMVVTYIVI